MRLTWRIAFTSEFVSLIARKKVASIRFPMSEEKGTFVFGEDDEEEEEEYESENEYVHEQERAAADDVNGEGEGREKGLDVVSASAAVDEQAAASPAQGNEPTRARGPEDLANETDVDLNQIEKGEGPTLGSKSGNEPSPMHARPPSIERIDALVSRSDVLRRHKKAVKQTARALNTWKEKQGKHIEQQFSVVDTSLQSIHAMVKGTLRDMQAARDAMKVCLSLTKN